MRFPLFSHFRLVLIAISFGALFPDYAAARAFHGLPFSRAYTFDEIGYVPRGAKMEFDWFGRLVIVREGTMVALNDDVWITVPNRTQLPVGRVTRGSDDSFFFGARGRWGILASSNDQILNVRDLTPPNVPKWTRTSYFDDIHSTKENVYFGSWNGSVVWNQATGSNTFYEMPDQCKIITCHNQVFACNRKGEFYRIDTTTQKLVPLPFRLQPGVGVEYSCSLSDGTALVSLDHGGLLHFDGTRFTEWGNNPTVLPKDRILALASLVDGKVAIAIGGKGVFLLNEQAELLEAWTSSEFQQVSDIASNEKGVLWLMNEDSIEKILYDSPFSCFGPKLGIRVRWPALTSKGDTTYAISDANLYEISMTGSAAPSQFQLTSVQVPGGAWSLASDEEHLLVGGTDCLYELEGEALRKIAAFPKLGHLLFLRKGLCLAIGSEQIGAFTFENGTWREAAPRVAGPGYSPIATKSATSVWVELASEGVLQVTVDENAHKIETHVIRPWTDCSWTNVSVVDDTVILTGQGGEIAFYSDQRHEWTDSPEIKKIYEQQAPNFVRIERDPTGNLWASQRSGFVFLKKNGSAYEPDAKSYNFLYDLYPTIQILPGNHIWLLGHQSLYHVNAGQVPLKPKEVRPKIVSLYDSKSGLNLVADQEDQPPFYHLGAGDNNLSIRLFSGTYSERQPSRYEFQIGDEAWARIDSGSLLTLRGLPTGFHPLKIRLEESSHPASSTTELHFEVAVPWYRSLTAVILYPVVAFAFTLLVSHAVSLTARRRSEALAALVQERTQQLEEAMVKLNQETHLAATLAERDRLTGEVHDSLQQGLSGAILQLDSTIKLPTVGSEARSRLNVVRSMLSFTRNEVQHVLWNQESQFLENGGIVDAIKKMAGLVNSREKPLRVHLEGTPIELDSKLKHQLLRITQEATTNAVRHSKATDIEIRIQFSPTLLTISIADNGVGFVVEEALAESGGHFGLRSIRSRAKKLGGSLRISSQPGKGTAVTIEVEPSQTQVL